MPIYQIIANFAVNCENRTEGCQLLLSTSGVKFHEILLEHKNIHIREGAQRVHIMACRLSFAGSPQWPHLGHHLMAKAALPHHRVGGPRQDRPSGAEADRSGV